MASRCQPCAIMNAVPGCRRSVAWRSYCLHSRRYVVPFGWREIPNQGHTRDDECLKTSRGQGLNGHKWKRKEIPLCHQSASFSSWSARQTWEESQVTPSMRRTLLIFLTRAIWQQVAEPWWETMVANARRHFQICGIDRCEWLTTAILRLQTMVANQVSSRVIDLHVKRWSN